MSYYQEGYNVDSFAYISVLKMVNLIKRELNQYLGGFGGMNQVEMDSPLNKLSIESKITKIGLRSQKFWSFFCRFVGCFGDGRTLRP